MRFFAGLALLTTAVLLPAPAHAKEQDGDKPIVAGALGRKLERAVDEAAPDLWGSVLVARDGKILLAKGYGQADYDSRPNTPRTLHEIASSSKQVAAAALLHLQQKRKLKLTDTLGKIFKGVPEDKRGITVHQLLTHTSGISGNVGVPYASTLDTKSYVRKILSEPLAHEPGARFEYCNAGYALLAAIVETVTKRPFEAYVEKHLFKPAKCKDSGFITDKDLVKTGRASTRRGRRPNSTAVEWFWGWGYRGMGGVVTTVLDLLRWDRALRGDGILDAKSKAMLYAPHKSFYACGWHVGVTDRGTRRVHHSGGVEGYGCNVVRYLEDDVCVFVLSNDGDRAFAATQAVEKLLFEPVSLKVKIDVSAYGQGGRNVKLPAKLAWKVGRKKRALLLQLQDGKEVVLEVEVPRGTYAKKLLFEAGQAVASRAADDDGKAPAFEATLYLRGYGSSPRIQHAFGSVDIQAEYRGRDAQNKPVLDERATLILKDTRSGGWTGMVKMNLAAARALHAALAKVVK